MGNRPGRISFFGPNYNFLRSFRLPGGPKLGGIAAGTGVVLAQAVKSSDPAAPPVLALDPATGQELGSFGRRDTRRTLGYGLSIAEGAIFQPLEDGGAVVAWPWSYRLFRFAPSGSLQAEWRRAIEGFPDSDRTGFLPPASPGHSRETSLEEWLAAAVVEPFLVDTWIDPTSGWLGVLLATPARPRGLGPGAHRYHLEYWDLTEGAVVASVSDVPPAVASAGGGYFLNADEDQAGFPVLKLWRAVVINTQPE